jgi:hypothetical protein
MRTDHLIDVLAADAAPRRNFGRHFVRMLACGFVIASATFLLLVGVRHDILVAVDSPRFLFKYVVMLALAVTASAGTHRAGDPSGNLYPWMKAVALVPILLAGAIVLELVTVPSGEWGHRLIGHDAWRCMMLIPFLSAGPLGCLLLALRQGAPTRPGFAGAMAGLCASGIAATLYAANCTDDSPLFIATWFSLAILIVTAAGYLAGRRLLTW